MCVTLETFNLGYLRVDYCPAGLENWPRRARYKKKAAVKKRRNPQL